MQLENDLPVMVDDVFCSEYVSFQQADFANGVYTTFFYSGQEFATAVEVKTKVR